MSVLLCIFLFSALLCEAGVSSLGVPFITNYNQDVYKSFPQNWQAVQDKRGVVYFANQTGILEYDGKTWRLLKIAENIFLRSLAFDNDGVFYFGTSKNFGYLDVRDNGKLMPVILSDSLKAEEIGRMSDFWKIVTAGQDVFFFNEYNLFKYNKDSKALKAWDLNFEIFQVFIYRNNLYLSSFDRGLLQFRNDSILPVKGGHIFKDKAIVSLLTLPNDSVVVVTYENGIYRVSLNNDELVADNYFDGLNEFLKDKFIYTSVVLDSSRLAFGIMGEGLIITGINGVPLHLFSEANGLISNNIAHLFVGRLQNQPDVLWIVTDRGISKAELFSPLQIFSGESGVKGFITSMLRHNDVLYVASLNGLYYLDIKTGTFNNGFRRMENVQMEVWDLVVLTSGNKKSLIACTSHNLIEINGEKATPLTKTYSTRSLYQMKTNHEWAYILTDKGLAKLKITNNSYTDLGDLKNSGISNRIKNIAKEEPDGSLWMLSTYSGIIHFDTKKDTIIKQYSIIVDSLPLTFNCLFEWKGELFTGTGSGLLQYNKSSDSFEPASFFPENSGIQKLNIVRVNISGNTMWAVVKENEQNKIVKINLRDGLIQSVPFKRINEQDIWGFYRENNGYVYIYSTDKFYGYDEKIAKRYDVTFNCLIRNVVLNGDSTIFHGANYSFSSPNLMRTISDDNKTILKTGIPYNLNRVIFEFAAPFFESEESTQYSFYLEGNDKTWSEWTSRTDKEYTNLFEGAYTFRVKARNVYGHESEEASFSFVILPPWYRTYWAYGGYLILLGLLIWGIVKLSIYRLQKINEAYGKYLPGSFLKMLDKRRIIDFRLGDMAEKEMSIMFSDIRSYTSLSESMSPHDNFRFLVRYLKHVGEMLNKNKGFPVQYYGDGVMAMFHGHTNNAVQAAVDMHKKVAAYSAERAQKGRRAINIGVGLHSGKVIMGIRGDQWRWEGGIVGDAVNIAARIESLTKIFGASTIVTGDIYDRLQKPNSFTFRHLGKVQVKGKDKIVSIYELLDGNNADTFAVKFKLIEPFNYALSLLLDNKPQEALNAFSNVLNVYEDKATLFYMDIIQKMLDDPEYKFEGVLVLDMK